MAVLSTLCTAARMAVSDRAGGDGALPAGVCVVPSDVDAAEPMQQVGGSAASASPVMDDDGGEADDGGGVGDE